MDLPAPPSPPSATLTVPTPVRPSAPGPLPAYRARVASGALVPDQAQALAAETLQDLWRRVRGYDPRPEAPDEGGFLSRFFRRKSAEGAPEGTPNGLYLVGGVGRGKSMLMDLFFACAELGRKRRIHFHRFMQECHARIHAWKKANPGDADPIPPLADTIAAEAALLCFDEFQVHDIADAMILGRLFTALFEQGVVVVATSNVEPDRLYESGLNRTLFLPFVDLLQERMEVVHLDARADFRLEKLAGSPVYHTPADTAAREALDRAFHTLSGQARGAPLTLHVKGHAVEIPQAAGGVARFRFSDLCDKPLGASDYLAIARRFHTVIVEGIPRMGFEQRNEAKRFITLIDTLYDSRVKLLASADAEAPHLYRAETGREAFEFGRTVSRLIEMRSEEYLSERHGRAESSGNSTGLVET